MDLTPFVAPIVTAIITGGATYAAMVSRLTRLEVRVEHLEHDQIDTNTLSAQIAALSAKMDDLRADVEKHNNIVERMCKVEQQIPTMWKRQDELRDAMHDIKIGGTN